MRNGKRFTEEEKQLLLTKTKAECIRLMPHRSPGCISSTKHKLVHGYSIKGEDDRKPYTVEEDAIFREHFPDMALEAFRKKYFPKRSLDRIIARARFLKLRKKFKVAQALDADREIVEQIITDAVAKGLTIQQLDKFCNAKGYFAGSWRRLPLNMDAISRAVALLGGQIKYQSGEAPKHDQLLRFVEQFSRQSVPTATSVKTPPKWTPKATAAPAPKPKSDGEIIKQMAEAAVPRNLLGRADIVSAIVLAGLEGTISANDLKTNPAVVRRFINQHNRENHEGSGYAVSLDQPLPDGRSRYDLLADNRATAA